MNDMRELGAAADTPASAFGFTGTWREFLPIAATNLLLIVVTLGFYRFWAKARERRYLWGRTRFIDDHLEWTGTGKEMFVGFLVVVLGLLPLLLFFQFGFQAMVARGEESAAILIMLAIYIGFFYLLGVGQFRALRYRLSRSWWHGIRGGAHARGWNYGGQFVWKNAVGYMIFGLFVPWAQTSLWNDRWNRMSFGRHRVEASADTDGLFGRWMLVYLAPLLGLALSSIVIAMAGVSDGTALGAVAGAVISFGAIFIAYQIATIAYKAAFYRKVVEHTEFAGLQFAFTASTPDWMKLILGNIALVVFTLGLGSVFVGYRNWSLFVRHMEAAGEIDLDALLQSQTSATGDAEGLADAFDIGAI
jgi:uncharacterized membrane protein YjgN (DUF898 family)